MNVPKRIKSFLNYSYIFIRWRWWLIIREAIFPHKININFKILKIIVFWMKNFLMNSRNINWMFNYFIIIRRWNWIIWYWLEKWINVFESTKFIKKFYTILKIFWKYFLKDIWTCEAYLWNSWFWVSPFLLSNWN
jgi:hypothetical protein